MKIFGIISACIFVVCFCVLKYMERNKPKAKKRPQTANNTDVGQFFGAVSKIALWFFLVALLVLILAWLGIGVFDTIRQIFSK